MASILIIGADSDGIELEELPPGITPESIRGALSSARSELQAKGHEAQILWTTSAERIADELADAVRGRRYDVLVIGAGLRTLSTDGAALRAADERDPRACAGRPPRVQHAARRHGSSG